MLRSILAGLFLCGPGIPSRGNLPLNQPAALTANLPDTLPDTLAATLTERGISSFDPDKDTVAPDADRILGAILCLRFREADSLLVHDRATGDPRLLYLRNYLEFLDALISGERLIFDRYLEDSGQRIESIRNGTKQHPGSLLDLSSIHLQSSFLCAVNGENYKALKHFFHAYRYLRQGEEADPGNAGKLRNRGIITLIIGSLPDEYRWILKVFGMRGEVEEGFGYLKEYAALSQGNDGLEACLLLKFSRRILASGKPGGRDPGKAGEGSPGDCPGGSRTLDLYADALGDLGSGNSPRVIDRLGGYTQAGNERAFPYIDLLLGEALLRSLDSSANVPLERFLHNHTGMHYRHYVWQKLSWHYFLEGDTLRYREARQKVLDSGEPVLEADRQALNETLDTLPLNPVLLKARLLFDGGYYPRALACLENPSAITLRHERDSVEYLYRLARIYGETGNTVRAIAFYKQVIADQERSVSAGRDADWYFAPHAALHLGMIYESAGDPDRALEYYRECLKINRSAYKKSIDFKARQGIRRTAKHVS